MGLLGKPRLIARCMALAIGGVAALQITAQVSPASAQPPAGVPALSGGVNGQVYATLVVGDTVYVGGQFTLAQTQSGAQVTRDNLAAFQLGTGKLLTSWKADTDGIVRSLAAGGGELYVGGQYTTIGGVVQGKLASVSLTTGAVDQTFRPRLNAGVRAIQVASGAVYAGGGFTRVDGHAQTHLAELDATTGVRVPAFTAATNGSVNALAMSPDGTKLAVAGSFTTLAGAPRADLGMVDPVEGSVVGPSFASTVNPMLGVTWSDDASALFAGTGNAANVVARWNPTTGVRGWHVSAGGDIQAVAFYGGTVYAGFHDNYKGNKRTKLLAINASSGVVSTAFRPTFDRFWGVRAISAGPWGLVIGGQFTTVSGVWAHGWAQWPPRTRATLTVDSAEQVAYGATSQVHVTLSAGATGTVTLSGAGEDRAEPVRDGSTTFNLPRNLRAGQHSLTVTYSGDASFSSAAATRAMLVTKTASNVRATVTRKARAGRTGTVKVTVTGATGGGAAARGSVRLSLSKGHLHRTVRARTLHPGAATISLPRLGGGRWHLVTRYTGDVNHRAAKELRALVVGH